MPGGQQRWMLVQRWKWLLGREVAAQRQRLSVPPLASPLPPPNTIQSPNLLVDSAWRVKVADFNLSRLWAGDDASAAAATSTASGMNPRWWVGQASHLLPVA